MITQLLQIPGGKLVTDGLGAISNSDSLLINKLLVILLILLGLSFFCVIKYLIKKNKEDLASQLVSNAERHAIDIGAQQLVLTGKDEVIKTLTAENKYLKEVNEKLGEDKNMILRDNIDALKQLSSKIGQNTDVAVNILGTIQQNHENMKLFLFTDIKVTK